MSRRRKTRRIILWSAVLIFAASLLACSSTTSSHDPLPTVKQVRLQRYAGHWYEVARLPTPFQKADERAEAEYRLQPDGTLAVKNTAIKPDGSRRSIEGKATVVEGSNGSRLRVKFEGLAGLVPVSSEGNYWIIALDVEHYGYALVGTPDRKFLWLLARSPSLDPDLQRRLLLKAKVLGFATQNMISPGADQR